MLLSAAVSANDAETTEESSGWTDSLSNWVSSEQDPVSFDSITVKDPYTLTGRYGRYTTAGINFVFIAQTVGGAQIPDGGMVMTWAEFEDPDVPGNYEAFYCSVLYDTTRESSNDVDIETFEGTEINLADRTGNPEDWCSEPEGAVDSEENTGCKHHFVSQWQEFPSSDNYPSTWDADTSISSQACSGTRLVSTSDNFIEIKTSPVEYQVKTGYKVYADRTNYIAGNV